MGNWAMIAVNRWQMLTFILAICCAVLAFRVFDQGLTHTYMEAGEESSVRRARLVAGLIEREWRELDEEEIVVRLKAYADSRPSDSLVLKREPDMSAVCLDTICFEFRGKKLVRVR
jgi:hypothetical protein